MNNCPLSTAYGSETLDFPEKANFREATPARNGSTERQLRADIFQAGPIRKEPWAWLGPARSRALLRREGDHTKSGDLGDLD